MRRLAALAAGAVVWAACSRELPLEPSHRLPAADLAPPDGYEVTYLGTLGGYSSWPLALNDLGQVVGYSETADRHVAAFLWEDGVMYDLHAAFPNGYGSSAQAISPMGKIAGLRQVSDSLDARVFTWDRLTPPPALTGVTRDLDAGRMPDPATRVIAVNDAGDVLADVRSALYGMHAMRWQGGVVQELPGLARDAETRPTAWNASGLIAGMSYQYERGAFYTFTHPVVWENGAVRDLGVLAPATCPAPGATACGYGEATGVNDQGVVIGFSTDSAGRPRAFLWQDGVLRDLGAFPGQKTWARGLNNAGQVVGDWGAPTGSFLWENGVVQDLGSLGGGGTRVAAINDAGEVVGSSVTPALVQRAFVWRNGTMENLGLGPMGGMGSAAIAINARGDILGMSGNCAFSYDGVCSMYPPIRALLWRKVQPMTAAARATAAGGGRP